MSKGGVPDLVTAHGNNVVPFVDSLDIVGFETLGFETRDTG